MWNRLRELHRRLVRRYRPERHYMMGFGPACAAKKRNAKPEGAPQLQEKMGGCSSERPTKASRCHS
jgi:hypothetical protein